MKARILIFAKAPVPGKVKTRLIPALGPDGAAKLAAAMLDHILAEARAAGVGLVGLCTDPAPEASDWDRFRGRPDRLEPQGDGDLGQRLARAAKRVLDEGDSALLIGADCPELGRYRLSAAVEQLQSNDCVIHPTADGGYALLGLNRFDPSLFEGIEWSTASVAADTLDRIARLGWAVHVGEMLHDIDEPADLERIRETP